MTSPHPRVTVHHVPGRPLPPVSAGTLSIDDIVSIDGCIGTYRVRRLLSDAAVLEHAESRRAAGEWSLGLLTPIEGDGDAR